MSKFDPYQLILQMKQQMQKTIPERWGKKWKMRDEKEKDCVSLDTYWYH